MHDDGAACRPAPPLHHRREVVATGQAGGSRQQRRGVSRAEECSGRQFAATLAAPRGHDGAPGAGPHAQPEPMSPRAATVVRLERALALGHGCRSPGARCSVLICAGSQRRITAVGDCIAGLRSVGHPLPAPAALLQAGPTRHATRTGRGESTQEYPPVGGRPREPMRPRPAPSKRASPVTAGPTRRYSGDACYPGVLVAGADVAQRACSCGAGRQAEDGLRADTSGIWGVCRSLLLTVHPQLWTTLWTPGSPEVHDLKSTTGRRGSQRGVRAANRPRPGVERGRPRALHRHTVAAATRVDAGHPPDRPAGWNGAAGGTQ